MKTKKILLIEDDPAFARLIMEMLNTIETFQYQLTLAENFKAALQYLSEEIFDAILLDLGLPESKGLDTFDRILEYTAKLPIIVLTGSDDRAFGITAIQKGAQDYLIKGEIDRDLISRSIDYAIERYRIQKRLRSNEEQLKKIVETTIDALILSDSSGTILLWNKGAQRIFGYNEDETIGKPFTMLMPERFRDAHKKGLERVVSTGKSELSGKTLQLAGLKKDGKEFPLELTLSFWQEDNEKFYIGVIRDITERKNTEDSLQRSYDIQSVISSILRISLEPLPIDKQLNHVLQQLAYPLF